MKKAGHVIISFFILLSLPAGCGRKEEGSEELLDAFLAGEIPAIYEESMEAAIRFEQLPSDEKDWNSYSAGERIVDGPYGGIYFDAGGGKVYVLAGGGDKRNSVSYGV